MLPVTGLLTDQLRTMAGAYPDEVAYRNLGDGSSLTFDQWERRSNRLARGLAARGVGKGDRVAIVMEADHILDWIVAYSATHKLGAVAVPLNNRLSPPEVRGILEHAEATAVLTSGSYGESIGPLIGSLPSLVVVATVGRPGIEGAVPLDEVLADDDSAVQAPLDGETWPTSCTRRVRPGGQRGWPCATTRWPGCPISCRRGRAPGG